MNAPEAATGYQWQGRPLSLIIIVLYKAVLGTVEVLFGLAFTAVALGVQQVAALGLVQHMMAEELSEDPNDFFVHWLLTHNVLVTLKGALPYALLVTAVGIVKLIIALGIWSRSRRAVEVSFLLVACLGVAGLINLAYGFSTFKLVAVAIDILVLYYLARVLPKYLAQVKP